MMIWMINLIMQWMSKAITTTSDRLKLKFRRTISNQVLGSRGRLKFFQNCYEIKNRFISSIHSSHSVAAHHIISHHLVSHIVVHHVHVVHHIHLIHLVHVPHTHVVSHTHIVAHAHVISHAHVVTHSHVHHSHIIIHHISHLIWHSAWSYLSPARRYDITWSHFISDSHCTCLIHNFTHIYSHLVPMVLISLNRTNHTRPRY